MPTTIDKPTKATETEVVQPNRLQSSTLVKTRVLLTLWTLGEATRGELRANLIRKRKKETAAEYEQRLTLLQKIISHLEETGRIEINNNKLLLATEGVRDLDQALLNPNFIFEAQIGAKTANALLRWIQQRISVANPNGTNERVDGKAVASYEEFKTALLKVFDRLNQDFNLDNLVPIYRIRREMSQQVDRSEFDDWFLEMQSQDILQLIGGEMPELTPDKAEDSIKTALGGVRYYAQRL